MEESVWNWVSARSKQVQYIAVDDVPIQMPHGLASNMQIAK